MLKTWQKLLHSHKSADVPETATSTETPLPTPSPKATRLMSLDVLRGLTVILMLLVNNLALDEAAPVQLTHAKWGEMVRLADFVFPWFLLCVGVALPFAVASWKRHGLSSWRVDAHIITRTLRLFALGLLLESAAQHKPVFSLGVLQLIALAYLLGALLSELPLSRRLLISSLMMVGYWAAMSFITVPSVGKGIHSEVQNLSYYLNLNLFGSVGLWGLPSVIPTAAAVILGSVIGDFLINDANSPKMKLAMLFASGFALILAATTWKQYMPYSKALWTPPFLLLTTGTGTVLLAVFYWAIDTCKHQRWGVPLAVFGANPIAGYVAPILVKIWVLQDWMMKMPDGSRLSMDRYLLHQSISTFGRIAGGWAYTACYIGIWWGVLAILYKKHLFLKV